MSTMKRFNLLAIFIITIPVLIYYYLNAVSTEVTMNGDLHFYYVIFSSVIALLVGVAAYLEYKKSKVEKIFYISIGFVGVAVFYTFHALVTPNMSIVIFEFPNMIRNLSIFVLFGDLSRLWLALMMFLPDNLFEKNDQIKRYFNGYLLALLAFVMTGVVLFALTMPEVFPVFKNDDLTDTNFAILTKVVTLLFIGINALKYFYSFKAKPNITILSFIVGLCLIMETAIIFMISKPWSSTWWLAHNIFLSSYIVIGFGVLYSYLDKEKYEFFDVLGQIEKYTKLLEEKNVELNTLANFDSLTGLSNRRHFMAMIEDYIKEAKSTQSSFALMFIDLDKFKDINDQYGHKTGDKLLEVCSKKIISQIKSGDIASRIGGDEFVLLIKNVKQEQIENIAMRIIARIGEPIAIDGNICKVGASIGISIFPIQGTTVDELMSKSDEAMYRVKSEGKNNYSIATT